MRNIVLAQSKAAATAKLKNTLNPHHELLKLADLFPWDHFQERYLPLLAEGKSRSALLVRLAIGLIILEHKYSLSEEEVLKSWVENPYWQAFCGYEILQWDTPTTLLSLKNWKEKIGPEGVEMILESFRYVESQARYEHIPA